MATPATLPLSLICAVSVNVAPQAPEQPTFNIGLIVGPATVIPTNERVRDYSSAAAMLTDGFVDTDLEYLAAVEYFNATPKPLLLKVGVQNVGGAETLAAAVTACRAADSDWYGVFACGAVKADHLAIANEVEAFDPPAVYFYNTADSDVLAGTAGNVALTMRTAAYRRSFGIYTTTQSAAAPNNIYAGAAAMGVAMGRNTGLPGSYFTMKFKQLVGITPEPLTLTQLNTLDGEYINSYISVANAFTFASQGRMASGVFFDEVLFLDMLASMCQFNVATLLTQNPSIPQTDPGQTMLIHAVNQACDTMRSIGFIFPAAWSGVPINLGGRIALNTGDPLPNGYVALSAPYSTQLAVDRQARKAMPIYVALTEAGSVHSLLVGINVVR